MEVKLNHRQGRLSLPNQTIPFPSHRFSTSSPSPNLCISLCFTLTRFQIIHSSFSFSFSISFSFKTHFSDLPRKWRIQIKEMVNGQNSSKNLLVHVVKQGETLTSISEQYGVSVYSIATANKNIVDLDLVLEGQHINIPSSVEERNEVCEKTLLSRFNLQAACRRSVEIFRGVLDKKSFNLQMVQSLPQVYAFPYPAKTTGYVLVMVPLIALCIRCMIGAFRSRSAGELKRQTAIKSKGHHSSSKSARWRSALSDITEADDMGSESIPQSGDQTEDEEEISSQEVSRAAYSKLEHEYEKFLAECGMSRWGYWRGGSNQ